MAINRTLCAVAFGAVVAVSYSVTVASAATTPRGPRLGRGAHFVREKGGRKLGHCFYEFGVNAPNVDARGSSTTLSAPAGRVVTRIALKAGPNCFITPEGITGNFTFDADRVPCYVVEGLGSPTVTVRRVGNGRHCKDIGNVQMLSGAPPANPGGGSTGGGDTGGNTGGGDTGGGSTGGEETGPGLLVVCSSAPGAASDATVGVGISSRVSEIAIVDVVVGNCTAPFSLEPGLYTVSQGMLDGWSVSSIITDPLGRLFSADAMSGMATVSVVAGSTTTVTITSDVP